MTALTAPAGSDVLSELLIAQLLEDDLRILRHQDEAERIQLQEIMGGKSATTEPLRAATPSGDAQYALELQMQDAGMTSDALYAQTLQMGDASAVAGMQAALKLAAMEKNIALDAEYAKRLQQAENSGDPNVDSLYMKDAQNVLDKEAFESVLVADPNDKGKGKAKATEHRQIVVERMSTSYTAPTISPYPVCEICFEPCLPTHSPLAASLSANSSDKLPFGLRMPCPGTHIYCIACLVTYIQSKLDPSGDGTGNREAVVFPVRCPSCATNEWPEGISDELAERVLGDKGMVLWHHQKLLDTIPKYYCPNPRCSALVQVHDDPDEPQATCPTCATIMCVPCRVMWHDGLDCETYQALPADERLPEDRLVLELAKAQNWRRCPTCSIIVELTVGCNHITCRCGSHFCFKCGSRWVNNSCSRVPSCQLWDEQMLLEEREREREEEVLHRAQGGGAADAIRQAVERHRAQHERDHEEVAQRMQRIQAVVDQVQHRWEARPAVVQPPPPPAYYPNMRDDSLDWMTDPHVLCGRHWFTTNMLRDLTCGYCNTRLNSVDDLKYHLSNVRRHPVYACCGRFFKRDVDFQRHTEAGAQKFGYHAYQTRNDGNTTEASWW